MTSPDDQEDTTMPHIATGIDALARAERRARAVELRAQGMTIRQIATALDVSPTTAHDDIQHALRDIPAEGVDQLRQVWGERLERAVQLVMDRLAAGDLTAVDKLVALTNRAARLYGLDAPQQVAVAGSTNLDLDHAVRDLLAAMQEPPAPGPWDDQEQQA